MPELNLNQITEKLNAEFAGESRKLIFWYDANGDFKDDIDTLPLTNAKVYHLEPDNQFYTKYFFECVDKTTNYLVYAPFAKPAVRVNHLADTLKYSKEFFADRASLLTLDLGIDEKFKPVIQHYIKFFSAKDRTQKFYDLEIESFNRSTIEIALMSVLCKSKTTSFEDVVRCILTDDGFEDNKYLAEFEKYGLILAFWEHCEEAFGYTAPKPTLEKLVMTMFATYASKTIHADVPQAWTSFVSYKAGNILAFLDNLMNSCLYSERFEEISEIIDKSLTAKAFFEKMPAEAIADCNVFASVDRILIDWMTTRLENEDINARLNKKSIPELCEIRRKMHFGGRYENEYLAVENAYGIISGGSYLPVSGIGNIIKQYTSKDYKTDRYYHYFNYYYDKLEDNAGFERLRELVENVYTNDYLNKIAVNWTRDFSDTNGDIALVKQKNFYNTFVDTVKERVVVIISDALRYEVGVSLFEMLQSDEKCTAIISAMQSVLPSITRFGMAAMLPHKSLEFIDNKQVLVDGAVCDDTLQREAQLKKYAPNSRCIQYDDLKQKISKTDLREIFTGMDVVYVYHNQIDARGDKPNTENEVFVACEEAIEEIYGLIKRLAVNANTVHFIVTADHGFIYKRDKLAESDKISGIGGGGKRTAVTNQDITSDGVASVPLSAIADCNDDRKVYYPVGTDIFKVPGAGLNYVHGGCSPQEMLVPVIDVKTEKGHMETTTVQIALVSLTSKITNLITTLDFVQSEPVSSTVKETKYRIYFISDDNEKISNENIYVADKKETDTTKRIFRLKFTFKDKKYEKNRKYYLVAYDDKNDLEVLRHEIIMDIAFADDFGFGI